MHVDAGNIDFISWSSSVDVISEKNDFFLPWNSAWENFRRRFLNCYFLIISIDGFLFIDIEWTSGVTRVASAQLGIVMLVNVKWAFGITALCTFVNEFFQLVENFTSNGYYTLNFDEFTKKVMSEISDVVNQW